MEKIHLILFDIDGTLLDMSGAGRAAFVRTLHRVFGWNDSIEYISFSGATDLDVLRQIARRHEVSLTDEDADRFFEALPRELNETVNDGGHTLFPGVLEVLDHLAKRPHTLVGLVTGNIESCARIKLEQFDLNGHFMIGAFGHEHGDRDEIARLAYRRALGRLQPGESIGACFLVGDTPADVKAAKAIGARSITVATGRHDVHALSTAGADVVLDDLSDLERLIVELEST